ncbi:hypothetical protein [Primorskyibacter sp. 2E233]|uniref:hypothetical protein n=1 Tax=Primorskyibacter sp. 2E233 TaxID=3413431 RepID=UPI003BF0695A
MRRQFEAEGISIADWAKLRGYNPRTVYAVMQGALACKRGISHQIAVDLGLKKLPEASRLPGVILHRKAS